MVRVLATALLALTLAACGPGERSSNAGSDIPGVEGPRAALSTQNLADTRVAKALFGAMRTASAQASEVFGFYSRGCAAGNIRLVETGPTWQAMRLSRNRNWGQPIMIDFLQDLSRFAATQPGWEGLYIGDISQPRGGPMLTGHASHQLGIDADIWMLPPSRLNLTAAERENLSSIRTDRTRGAYVNDAWTPAHMAIVRRAAQDPRVQRIFIFPGAKVAMCDAETGDRSYLSKLRLLANHNYHFHVRLHCPPGSPNCEPQDPVPAGDGCDEARQAVANILNPPPPDPNYVPPPPRGEVRMSDLPGQCLSVLTSD
ncbi:penicillin-insensitive murein endopeptidase [Wenxinia marina]|uniref:Murein endopeptidase n=1 Tax=Wenxinia marina DSM 24838 TaxID=1123501 RepID=A0A0D0Q945_9RHOB|nr:penicillin-insensitive murein endopeptidase [Wenxinia marina]KIQ70949.1 Murein endopeptidase [Wenxinia marina DSM 24838]GGL56054.1 penicillin-insensitive murein endopeptidase [Wenxinia marina]